MKSGAAINGRRLAPYGESELSVYITRRGICEKEGVLMSDYEMLSLWLAIVSIFVMLVIAWTDTKK